MNEEISQSEFDDDHWMTLALELSRMCPKSDTAYSVGAVIVGPDGEEISRGFSRETDEKVHAEESALLKVRIGDTRLHAATIYSTLEPCSQRASRPRACAQLILDAGIPRVVTAWREPSLFVVDARGTELLTAAGVTVVELDKFAKEALVPNAHLPIG